MCAALDKGKVLPLMEALKGSYEANIGAFIALCVSKRSVKYE